MVVFEGVNKFSEGYDSTNGRTVWVNYSDYAGLYSTDAGTFGIGFHPVPGEENLNEIVISSGAVAINSALTLNNAVFTLSTSGTPTITLDASNGIIASQGFVSTGQSGLTQSITFADITGITVSGGIITAVF